MMAKDVNISKFFDPPCGNCLVNQHGSVP